MGHQTSVSGLRPSVDKLSVITCYPTPRDETELMRFVYWLPYIKAYIPKRADVTTILKEAVLTEGKGKSKRVVGFEWTGKQEKVFRKVKRCLAKVRLFGGDRNVQYNLVTDASKTGLGGVLFQLRDHPTGTISSWTNGEDRDHQVVMYLPFALTDAETRYQTTEREALAVLRCLEEVRWLVLGAIHPTILYTGIL